MCLRHHGHFLLKGCSVHETGSTPIRTPNEIFITPRVIGSVEEGTQLSKEFEERVQELKDRIGEAKGIKSAPGSEVPK